MAKYTEQEVWEGLKKSNTKILNYVVDLYLPRIEYYILGNSGSDKDALDIFQDALVVIYRKLHTPDFIIQCKFITFLYSICRLLWLKELRRRKGQETSFDEDLVIDFGFDVGEEQLKNERRKLYRKYLKLISKECQKIIVLLTKGFSLSEITKEMNYKSVNVTKNKKYKCKNGLIEKIRTSSKFKELKNERL